MRNSKVVQRRFELEEKLLHSLYTVMGVDQWEQTSADVVAAAVDLSPNVVERGVRHFVGIGLMETKLEYPGGGRVAHWKLLLPMPAALVKLEEEHQRELIEGGWELSRTKAASLSKELKQQPTPRDRIDTAVRDGLAVATERSGEEVRAIAGPDPESPFAVLAPLRRSESAALVEAAKQYITKGSLIATKVKELRDAGIKVDARAIKFERDARLETIALVLPYIAEIEGHDEKYARLRDQYRELETTHNLLKRDYKSLQRWRDEQIAGRPRTVVGSVDEATNGRSESAEAGVGAENSDRS